MAKKDPGTELAKPSAGAMALAKDRPQWLAEKGSEMKGVAELQQVVRPSFVKMVQKMSNEELTERFGVGALVLTPEMVLLTRGGEENPPVAFCPILFYIEYCKWAPITLKGSEPMIVDRTFDPKHPVALKTQSSATWSEPHPKHPNDPKFNYRYCQHLNYIIKLTDEQFISTDPVLVSFVKTSFGAGARLGKLIMSRKADIFTGQYTLSTRDKENAQGKFKVMVAENHPTEPWIGGEMYDELAKMHDEIRDALEKRRLETQYDDEVVEEAVFEQTNSTGSY